MRLFGDDMKTLTLSETIAKLEEMKARHGDVPLVLYDVDTSYYFTLTASNFEFQKMEDGSIRASVGVNEYTDQREEEPINRPVLCTLLRNDIMKAEQLTDTTIQEPKSEIVVELPNGQRVATQGYFHDCNQHGEEIIVLKAGRKLANT